MQLAVAAGNVPFVFEQQATMPLTSGLPPKTWEVLSKQLAGRTTRPNGVSAKCLNAYCASACPSNFFFGSVRIIVWLGVDGRRTIQYSLTSRCHQVSVN
jgi:hypothetical protein